MAKFNEAEFNVDKLDKKELEHLGIYLSALLSSDELEKLRADYHAAGGFKTGIPWHKYCLDNICVTYQK